MITTEQQVIWTSLIAQNRPIIETVVKEALAMLPQYPVTATTEQIAMIAKQRQGYEEAIENLFSKIPSDRIIKVESKFMDMSPN